MKKILILCTGNSCRSQMAHGFFQKLAGNYSKIYSAGIETHGLNPKAVETMQKAGIDISNYTSNHIDEYAAISFDYVITVCDHANEHCPIYPKKGAYHFHHNFSDPSKLDGSPEAIDKAFENTRIQIGNWVQLFVNAFLPK